MPQRILIGAEAVAIDVHKDRVADGGGLLPAPLGAHHLAQLLVAGRHHDDVGILLQRQLGGVPEAFRPVAEQAGVNSRWLALTTNVTIGDGVLTARSLIDANGGAASAGQAAPTIVRRDWGETD